MHCSIRFYIRECIYKYLGKTQNYHLLVSHSICLTQSHYIYIYIRKHTRMGKLIIKYLPIIVIN